MYETLFRLCPVYNFSHMVHYISKDHGLFIEQYAEYKVTQVVYNVYIYASCNLYELAQPN